jgi:hypothetical protein
MRTCVVGTRPHLRLGREVTLKTQGASCANEVVLKIVQLEPCAASCPVLKAQFVNFGKGSQSTLYTWATALSRTTQTQVA